MHAAVEHAAAERGPGSALVRAPHGYRPAGADSARTRRGIRGLGGADSELPKRGIPPWLAASVSMYVGCEREQILQVRRWRTTGQFLLRMD